MSGTEQVKKVRSIARLFNVRVTLSNGIYYVRDRDTMLFSFTEADVAKGEEHLRIRFHYELRPEYIPPLG